MIIPVILAGRPGTGLWPLSRESVPKQFLTLAGGTSLLQDTIMRLRALHEMAASILHSAALSAGDHQAIF